MKPLNIKSVILFTFIIGSFSFNLKAQLDTLTGFFVQKISFNNITNYYSNSEIRPSYGFPRIVFIEENAIEEIYSWVKKSSSWRDTEDSLLTNFHVVSWHYAQMSKCFPAIYEHILKNYGTVIDYKVFAKNMFLGETTNYKKFSDRIFEFLSKKNCYALYYGTIVVYPLEAKKSDSGKYCLDERVWGKNKCSVYIQTYFNKLDFLMLLF